MPLTANFSSTLDILKRSIEHNQLVYALNQYADTPPSMSDPLRAGRCAGLSLNWLVNRRENKDFDYDKVMKLCNSREFLYARAIQTYSLRLLAERDTSDTSRELPEYQKLLEATPLTLQRISPNRLILTAEDITCEEYGTNGLSYAILFGSGGRHAVAVQKQGPVYRFFDPNYGHFRFANLEEYEQWMTFFFKASTYNWRVGWIAFYHVV